MLKKLFSNYAPQFLKLFDEINHFKYMRSNLIICIQWRPGQSFRQLLSSFHTLSIIRLLKMIDDFRKVHILMLPLKIKSRGCENDTFSSKKLFQVLLISLGCFNASWVNRCSYNRLINNIDQLLFMHESDCHITIPIVIVLDPTNFSDSSIPKIDKEDILHIKRYIWC